jgi:hypothetical protein
MTGNMTDFAIDQNSGAVTVVPAGIPLPDCGKMYTNTVTANQPN